jgi:hypothetical protein
MPSLSFQGKESQINLFQPVSECNFRLTEAPFLSLVYLPNHFLDDSQLYFDVPNIILLPLPRIINFTVVFFDLHSVWRCNHKTVGKFKMGTDPLVS